MLSVIVCVGLGVLLALIHISLIHIVRNRSINRLVKPDFKPDSAITEICNGVAYTIEVDHKKRLSVEYDMHKTGRREIIFKGGVIKIFFEKIFDNRNAQSKPYFQTIWKYVSVREDNSVVMVKSVGLMEVKEVVEVKDAFTKALQTMKAKSNMCIKRGWGCVPEVQRAITALRLNGVDNNL